MSPERILKVAPDLTLPLFWVTLRTAFYGTSGAGKTSVGRLLAEQVHAAGQRFCAIDLKNDWYGLKSTADGKGAGIPAVIFGGPKQDLPLFEDAGAAVADAIVAIEQSVILDLDALSKRKQLIFLSAFLERLYDVNRSPLLLICDEADRYAPQKPMTPEAIQSLGASEDVTRRGRKRGIGSLWITQRTAVLNKNVSDLCDLTVVFRTPGARDLDELEDRVSRIATKEQLKQVMAAAPGLEDGQALVLSSHPKLRDYLPDTVRPIQFPMPTTFDSSATPGVDGRRREPKVLAHTDLEALRTRIADQVERAKADDPKEMKKKLAEQATHLAAKDKEIKKLRELESKLTATKELVAKPALTDADRELLKTVAAKLDAMTQKATSTVRFDSGAIITAVSDMCRNFEKDIHEQQTDRRDEFLKLLDGKRLSALFQKLERVQPQPVIGGHNSGIISTPNRTPAPRRNDAYVTVKVAPRASTSAESDKPVDGVGQRILNALAELEILGSANPRRELVAFLAGYSNLTSKGFANGIGALRSSGLVDYPGEGEVALTPAGQAGAVYPEQPRSSSEIQERVIRLLGGSSERILRPLIKAYPESLGRQDVAVEAGYGNLTSKGFANAIGRLRSLGFITYPDRGTIAAAPILFLET